MKNLEWILKKNKKFLKHSLLSRHSDSLRCFSIWPEKLYGVPMGRLVSDLTETILLYLLILRILIEFLYLLTLIKNVVRRQSKIRADVLKSLYNKV